MFNNLLTCKMIKALCPTHKRGLETVNIVTLKKTHSC